MSLIDSIEDIPPLCNGIYYLYDENRVVYIGISSCIRTRIYEHLFGGYKYFDKIDYLWLPEHSVNMLLKMEKNAISKRCPVYNKTHNFEYKRKKKAKRRT